MYRNRRAIPRSTAWARLTIRRFLYRIARRGVGPAPRIMPVRLDDP
jgi:hypothetical protein